MSKKICKISMVLALVLAIFSPFLLGPIGVGILTILLIINYIKLEKRSFFQKILLILYFVGIVFAYGGLFLMYNMENTGIDGIGEALIYGMMSKIGAILIFICPIIILVIAYKKLIFRKKTIPIICGIIVIVGLYFLLRFFLTTTKVSDNIPTVKDFQVELSQRGFLTNKVNYKLYGIKSKNKKAIALSFNANSNDKYPLYIFSIVDYPWIIYYSNGEIFAVSGKYYYSSWENEEKIICNTSDEIVSETAKITVYDTEINRYKKGDTIYYKSFNYYSNNSAEKSIFVDIPDIESWGTKVKQIEKININSLNSLKSR